MQQRYSDYGTKQQLQMHNRILLGEDRGSKKAYVLSNLDVCFDNGIIDAVQRETGKTYWAWRDIARRAQGCHSSPIYGDSLVDDESMPATSSETEDGAIREMFIILCGLVNAECLAVIDVCCGDANEENPLIIIQAFHTRINAIPVAFAGLEEKLYMARRLFEERVQNAVD